MILIVGQSVRYSRCTRSVSDIGLNILPISDIGHPNLRMSMFFSMSLSVSVELGMDVDTKIGASLNKIVLIIGYQIAPILGQSDIGPELNFDIVSNLISE